MDHAKTANLNAFNFFASLGDKRVREVGGLSVKATFSNQFSTSRVNAWQQRLWDTGALVFDLGFSEYHNKVLVPLIVRMAALPSLNKNSR